MFSYIIFRYVQWTEIIGVYVRKAFQLRRSGFQKNALTAQLKMLVEVYLPVRSGWQKAM
jgi:hypothetical protein